jgi:ribosomal protein L29
MKKKELSTISAQDKNELQKEVRTIRAKIIEMNVAKMTKPSKNVRERKSLRNRLAIILSIIRQKELQNG